MGYYHKDKANFFKVWLAAQILFMKDYSMGHHFLKERKQLHVVGMKQNFSLKLSLKTILNDSKHIPPIFQFYCA